MEQQNVSSSGIRNTCLNKDELDYLYNQGVKAFQVKRYDQASAVFQLIIAADNENALYLKALAATLQLQKNYAGASFYYMASFDIDGNKNADCIYYSAVCLFENHMFNDAKEKFNTYLALSNAEDKLVKRSNMYLDAINNINTNKEQSAPIA